MKSELLTKISSDELAGSKINKKAREWPFKNMDLDEAIQLKSGFNGKTTHQIAVYARAYNQNSIKDFEVYTNKVNGESVVQVLRTK